MTLTYVEYAAYTTEQRIVNSPKIVATRKGIIEKAKIPSNANPNNFMKLYFELPENRSDLSTRIPVWRKPTHALSPRRYRWCPGRRCISSITRRDKSAKSPASRGNLRLEKNASRR